MKRRDEIRHLLRGANPGERPGRAGTLLPARVTSTEPRITVERARAVLLAVLTAPRGWSPDNPPANLPPWFVQACAPTVERSVQEARERQRRLQQLPPEDQARAAIDATWSLPQWLSWFTDERYWYWWDARVTGERELVAEYVVYDWPAPTGSMIWLWRASGAISVDVF
jgi:hypothetical protein